MTYFSPPWAVELIEVWYICLALMHGHLSVLKRAWCQEATAVVKGLNFVPKSTECYRDVNLILCQSGSTFFHEYQPWAHRYITRSSEWLGTDLTVMCAQVSSSSSQLYSTLPGPTIRNGRHFFSSPRPGVSDIWRQSNANHHFSFQRRKQKMYNVHWKVTHHKAINCKCSEQRKHLLILHVKDKNKKIVYIHCLYLEEQLLNWHTLKEWFSHE